MMLCTFYLFLLNKDMQNSIPDISQRVGISSLFAKIGINQSGIFPPQSDVHIASGPVPHDDGKHPLN